MELSNNSDWLQVMNEHSITHIEKIFEPDLTWDELTRISNILIRMNRVEPRENTATDLLAVDLIEPYFNCLFKLCWKPIRESEGSQRGC